MANNSIKNSKTKRVTEFICSSNVSVSMGTNLDEQNNRVKSSVQNFVIRSDIFYIKYFFLF